MLEDRDAILVSRVREGDLGAFEALYEKYKVMVFRTAYAITRDRFTADEITQECFIRAYRAMPGVDVEASLGPWLHRIAANLGYNWWKAMRRQRLLPLDNVRHDTTQQAPDSPARLAQQDEMRTVLGEALESLNFEQRVAVILFYLNGFSIDEIAYVLDCPPGTVKSRLHYGRQKLKEKMGPMWKRATEVAYEF